MGIIATPGNSAPDFPILSAGSHVARCYSVIDLGTQAGEYQGKPKLNRKIRITFEVPAELTTDGRPMAIGRSFTLSTRDGSAMRDFLKGWRGKDFTEAEAVGFDVSRLLGQPAMLGVMHEVSSKGRTYAKLHNAQPIPKGMVVPPAVNPVQVLSLDQDFDAEVFAALPKFLQDDIVKSPEYAALTESVSYDAPAEDDDIPF